MKLKCDKCGKKEVELMSKHDIKASKFANVVAFEAAMKMVVDWFVPSKYVCRNCGYTKDA